MERHKCGFRPVALNQPFTLVGHIDAALAAQPDEQTLQGGIDTNGQPHSVIGKANFVDFTRAGTHRHTDTQTLTQTQTQTHMYIYIYIYTCTASK